MKTAYLMVALIGALPLADAPGGDATVTLPTAFVQRLLDDNARLRAALLQVGAQRDAARAAAQDCFSEHSS